MLGHLLVLVLALSPSACPQDEELKTLYLKLRQGSPKEVGDAAMRLADLYGTTYAKDDKTKTQILKALDGAFPASAIALGNIGLPATGLLLTRLEAGGVIAREVPAALSRILGSGDETYAVHRFPDVVSRIRASGEVPRVVKAIKKALTESADLELKARLAWLVGRVGLDAYDALTDLSDLLAKIPAKASTDERDLMYHIVRAFWVLATPYYQQELSGGGVSQAEIDKEEKRYEALSVTVREKLAPSTGVVLALLGRPDAIEPPAKGNYTLEVPAAAFLVSMRSPDYLQNLVASLRRSKADDESGDWDALPRFGAAALEPLAKVFGDVSAPMHQRIAAARLTGLAIGDLRYNAKTQYVRLKRAHPVATLAQKDLKSPAVKVAIDALRASSKGEEFKLREAAAAALKAAGE